MESISVSGSMLSGDVSHCKRQTLTTSGIPGIPGTHEISDTPGTPNICVAPGNWN